MSIRGNLEEASLPDFLQLLSLGRKTGRLSVRSSSNLGYIFLDAGRIVHAVLVNRPDRLGDILARNHEITTAQLEEAIRVQGRVREKKVGEILIDLGAIDREVLDRYVRRQTEEAIYFLLSWQEGEIEFERDFAPRNEILVSIDPEMILMEGARRTDEWTVIEQEIPSLHAVFKLDPEPFEAADIKRTSDLNRIVELLDGTRDAHQIIEETGLGSFEVGKALYDLVTAGCAHPMRRDVGEAPPDVADETHLDFPQLESYVARSGVFTDETRRKRAAKHIVDCSTCSSRLSKAYQRATGAHAVAEVPVTDTTQAVTAAVEAAAATTTAIPAVPAPEQLKHLSDGEMLRYVRHEGEFIEDEPRRRSGLHIADCPECTRRVQKAQRASRAVSVVPDATVKQPKKKKSKAATQPRAEHLSTAELRQYAARTAPFAKGAVRKAAGLHIADCRPCAAQLKEVEHERQTGTVPAVAAHAVLESVDVEGPVPQHLDFAKLRAYAERTGVYADDEVRRYARRHIMDCEQCTDALRSVRRDLKDMAQPKEAAPAADRRHDRDRRVPDDRRGLNRRANGDRRIHDIPRRRERRVMLRRVQADRRVADRRSLSRRTAPVLDTVALASPSASDTPPVATVQEPVAPALADAPRTMERRMAPAPSPWPTARVEPPLETAAPVAPAAPAAPVERMAPEMESVITPPTPVPPAPVPPEPAALPETETTPTALSPPETSAAPRKFTDLFGEPLPPPKRRQSSRPLVRPSSRPPTDSSWQRVAAVVAIALLSGTIGWLGRSAIGTDVGPPVTSQSNGGSVAPEAVAPPAAVAMVDSARVATVDTATLLDPSEPEPVAAAVTPPVATPPQRTEPPPQPVRPAETRTTSAPAAVVNTRPPAVQSPRPVVEAPPPEPVAPPPPVNAYASGVVRDGTGAPLANVRLRLPDQDMETVSGPTGEFVLTDVPPGSLVLTAQLAGYTFESHSVSLSPGDSVQVEVVGAATPRATEPDQEIGTGQWEVTDRVEAEFILGTPLPVIGGLWTETIAKSTGRRPRVRIAQLTTTGDRVAMVISRPRPQNQVVAPQVSALRVIPGTSAYPVTTGTANFGVLLVTAKTSLPADALQQFLNTLREASAGSR